MSTMRSWTKRTFVVTTAAMAAGLVGSPSAEAATTNGSFDVTATVSGSCSINPQSLAFPGYTTNQASAVNGATTIEVVCPGASGSYTLPVELKLSTASGSYAMSGPGGALLTYGLFFDSARTVPFSLVAADPGAAYTVDAASYVVNIYGRIDPNQPAPTGSYSQVVTATLTY